MSINLIQFSIWCRYSFVRIPIEAVRRDGRTGWIADYIEKQVNFINFTFICFENVIVGRHHFITTDQLTEHVWPGGIQYSGQRIRQVLAAAHAAVTGSPLRHGQTSGANSKIAIRLTFNLNKNRRLNRFGFLSHSSWWQFHWRCTSSCEPRCIMIASEHSIWSDWIVTWSMACPCY